MKRHYSILIFILLPLFPFVVPSVSSLQADEFEIGMIAAAVSHNDDSFSGGVYRFRPGLYRAFYRAVAYEPFGIYGGGEVFVRWRGPISDLHSFGFAFGQEQTGKAQTIEWRSSYWSKVDHTFDFKYFLFTYHYTVPVQSYFRNLSLEIGGGMGFLPLARRRINGFQTDFSGYYRRYDGLIESNQGFQYRLDLSLVKKWRALVVRLGGRIDYRVAGNLTGKAGSNEVKPFTMTDGTHALTPDLLDIVDLQQQVQNQYLDTSLRFEGVVKGPAQLTWGSTSLFLSVGFRF